MRKNSLESHLTDARLAKMKRVLSHRLAWLTVVLDNVYDPHNISAILRSCEAFGVQDVHVIESVEEFNVNKAVSHHSEKWLTFHRWPNFRQCRAYLRRREFKLYATCFSDEAVPIDRVPLDRRIAIVFGNEHRGVEEDVGALCDGKVIIPMHGFVQSLNVSVAAAVALSTIATRLRNSCGQEVFLSRRRQSGILRQWLSEHAGEANQGFY